MVHYTFERRIPVRGEKIWVPEIRCFCIVCAKFNTEELVLKEVQNDAFTVFAAMNLGKGKKK
jgi:hypothetical protein